MKQHGTNKNVKFVSVTIFKNCQTKLTYPKIDAWAIRGPTFEVLGGFLRSLIFDEFSIGEKSA